MEELETMKKEGHYDLLALLTQVSVMLKLPDQQKLDQKINKLKNSGALKVLASRESKDLAENMYTNVAKGTDRLLPMESWSKKDRDLVYSGVINKSVQKRIQSFSSNDNNAKKKPFHNNNGSNKNQRGRGGYRGGNRGRGNNQSRRGNNNSRGNGRNNPKGKNNRPNSGRADPIKQEDATTASKSHIVIPSEIPEKAIWGAKNESLKNIINNVLDD